MKDKWEEWIRSYSLPEEVHWYLMNGKLVFKLSGYGIVETNYVYLSDLKDILVNGIRLDELDTEEKVHKAIKNTVLKIQIDLTRPRTYGNFYFNGKNNIVAP